MKLSDLKGNYTVESEPQKMKLSDLAPGSYTIEASKAEKEEPGYIGKTLGYLGRGLDYPGGLLRTAVAQAGDALTDKDLVSKEDWQKALVGSAPTSSEYLGRAGLENPEIANIPYVGPVGTRDVGGFALDVLSDPLSFVGKAIRPAGKFLETTGKDAYRSAFKKIDERLAEKGTKKLADVLLEHGAPTGTTKTISTKANEIGKGLLEKRGALYDEASKLGANVDIEKASQAALQEAQHLKRVRGAEDLGQKLEQNVMELYQRPGESLDPLTLTPKRNKLPALSLEEASELKSRLYDVLPEKAFDKFGRIKKDAQVVTKKQAQGIRQAILDEANKVRPGLGDEIDKLNVDLGSILESRQPTKMQIRRGETPNAVTSVDAMLGALTSPAALATKKAADLSKTTAFRTNLGKILMETGKLPIDPALQRGFINMSRPNE